MTSEHSIGTVDRRSDAERFRGQHPTVVVNPPAWSATARGGRWVWQVALEAGPTFRSGLDIDLGAPHSAEEPAGVGAVLAMIDALSYWKAAVPSRIVYDGPLAGSARWWAGFIANSMGEHLWRNGLDPSWLPTLDAGFTDSPMPAPARRADEPATLVLHSGGKDSITAAHLAHRAGRQVRPVSYQPTSAMRAIVDASAPPGGWSGLPVTLARTLDPQLFALNDQGYLNGHTPYSGWLAAAATAAADLCSIGHVAAGNSRSDDEPNINTTDSTGRAWHINHQWTKSREFEAAWTEISGPHRRYASPLRPLFELAVLAGLAVDPLPAADRALSCNRSAKAGHDGRWCGRCPKCLWTAAALDAIAGPGAGRARLGVDPLAETANAALLSAMCGRNGPVPFECAGTAAEVRAVLRELAARPDVPAAVTAMDPADLSHDTEDTTVAGLLDDIAPAPLLAFDQLDTARAWAATARDHACTTHGMTVGVTGASAEAHIGTM